MWCRPPPLLVCVTGKLKIFPPVTDHTQAQVYPICNKKANNQIADQGLWPVFQSCMHCMQRGHAVV